MSKTEPQASRIQAIPEQAPKVSATETHTKQYKRTEAAGGGLREGLSEEMRVSWTQTLLKCCLLSEKFLTLPTGWAEEQPSKSP